jgi:hypothetical protein
MKQKESNARCEVRAAVLLKIHVCWHVIPCRLVSNYRRSNDAWAFLFRVEQSMTAGQSTRRDSPENFKSYIFYGAKYMKFGARVYSG